MDEVKSAKILLKEASNLDGQNSIYSVNTIPLPEEEGFTVIAFSLPKILCKWGGKICELSLDSACELTIIYN